MDGAAMPATFGPDGVARTTRQLESVNTSSMAFRSDRLVPPYIGKLESTEGRLKVWDLASRPTNL